ncbi:MAG: protein translocase subunit SecD [Anaerolineales bacterium]|nr:protein translocase subunit SecD [Anaerolineales bacterium]
MFRNQYTRLFIILLISALAIWIDASNTLKVTNPINSELVMQRSVNPRLGLDLQGGLQVLLEADLPANAAIDAEAISVARTIIENRTNALGVSENVIQVAGDRRIVGDFPGLEDSEAVLAILQRTGLLEFVDMGTSPVEAGTIIQTDYGQSSTTPSGSSTPESTTPTITPTQAAPTPAATGTPEATATPATEAPIIYHTAMTGAALKTVTVVRDTTTGAYEISFVLKTDSSQLFSDYTGSHTNQYLAIVLDKEVISVPVIKNQISDGQGVIQGNFTNDSANALAIQLRYGSLPVPLKIVETRIVGPTLGEDSLQKSLIAGIAGMIIVILFMALYYRLPGIVADISILFYAAIAFAIFKYFHFTLTLPGIAGFMLSTGAALDANILIFERLKEELRSGRTLAQAVDQGWKRAWSSIRDSNIAALITSIILFWFGSTFGATIVKGFSLTLAIGVIVSLFTAIFVTRTLLALVLQWFKPMNHSRWFGI